jgi:hypothetical protein
LEIVCDDNDETTIDYCEPVGGCAARPIIDGPIEELDYDY